MSFKDVLDFLPLIPTVGFFLLLLYLGLRQLVWKDAPYYIHLGLYFPRGSGEDRAFKTPTLERVILPRVFSYGIATRLLFFAQRWAKNSPQSRIICLPKERKGWLQKLLYPDLGRVMTSLRTHLSQRHAHQWVRRAGKQSSAEDETTFVIALAYEWDNQGGQTSVLGAVIPEWYLEEVAAGEDAPRGHPTYHVDELRRDTFIQIVETWKAIKDGGWEDHKGREPLLTFVEL